ncbi:MAG: DUF2341 domain-containing protein, partial [Candidatus Kariarchaeaceae archaeon]
MTNENITSLKVDNTNNLNQAHFSPGGKEILEKLSDVPLGWSYKKMIDISPATSVADYQIMLIVSVTNFNYSEAKPDGSDLRFYDFSNNSLNYWIESWNITGISIIWVKIPTAGTSQIYMYYGNPTAVSKSN